MEESWHTSKMSLFSLHKLFGGEQIIFLFLGTLATGSGASAQRHLLLTPRAERSQCLLPSAAHFASEKRKCHLGSLKASGGILQEAL